MLVIVQLLIYFCTKVEGFILKNFIKRKNTFAMRYSLYRDPIVVISTVAVLLYDNIIYVISKSILFQVFNSFLGFLSLACLESEMTINDNPLSTFWRQNMWLCQNTCANDTACQFFVFDTNIDDTSADNCKLMSSDANKTPEPGSTFIIGPKICPGKFRQVFELLARK